MKPLWEHDCKRCIFLGSFHQTDLYYCKEEMIFVARHSDDPPDNTTTPLRIITKCGIDNVPIVIVEAYFRAKESGIIE